MQNDIFKKIITLIYLLIFLFGLFVPFTVNYAQTNSLVLSVDKPKDKPNLKIGETGKITATNTSGTLVGGETVYFSSVGNDTGLNPKTCTLPGPPQIPSCSVNFNSLIEGTFTLRANVTLGGTLYESSIPITIKDCLDPKQVLVKGICTTPNTLVPGDGTTGETTDTTYTPLAPLPGFEGKFDTLPSPSNQCPFGNYLNIMIKLVIGIAAVLAMVMIVMGGIEYMTSDLISSKEAGKDTIKNALLGLLIALGAYLILNTINPKLLSACLDNLPQAEITIQDFQISGAQSINGKPGAKVSFSKVACPIAKTLEEQTKVSAGLILAIFRQESSNGSRTGGCLPANANMYSEDIAALKTIVGIDKVATTNVSCASGGGHGGAIGVMQFRPTTWLKYGAGGNPWETKDAMTASASLLKATNGINDPYNAACKYYSGDPCTPGREPPNVFYGQNVINNMNSINQQIANGC